MRTLALALALVASAGCFPPGANGGAKLAEVAYDMNVATRFGRIDIAMDHVAPTSVETFMAQHASWGRSLRVLDVEFAGVRMLPNGEARVDVLVMWQRVNGATLRTTQLAQTWRDHTGRWLVVKEEEAGGDVGLLDEPAPPAAGKTDAANADGTRPTAAVGAKVPSEVAPSFELLDDKDDSRRAIDALAPPPALD
jgi:hypothetical protein